MSALAEAVARLRLAWKEQPHSGFHRCGRCGEQAACKRTGRGPWMCFECYSQEAK